MSSVRFTVESGGPTLLHVEGADGKKYELRVVVSVFDVEQLDSRNETTGIPNFGLRAQLAVDAKERP